MIRFTNYKEDLIKNIEYIKIKFYHRFNNAFYLIVIKMKLKK